MGMAGGLRRPFTRLSDRFGVGAAGIGDLQYLAAGEVTGDFLPPDGRAVYQTDYPGLKEVLIESLEGDTLNWVDALGLSGSIVDRRDAIALGADGKLYIATGFTVPHVITLAPDGSVASGVNTSTPPTNAGLITAAAVGKHIVFGDASGNAIIYNTETLAYGPLVAVLNSGGSQLLVRAFNERYCVAVLGGSDTYAADVNLLDVVNSVRIQRVMVASNGDGRGFRLALVRGFMAVSFWTNQIVNSYVTMLRLNATAGTMDVVQSGVFNSGNGAVSSLLAIDNFLLVAGSSNAVLHRYAVSAAGNISDLTNLGSLDFWPEHWDYDALSDTFIYARQGTQLASVRRMRGKKSKILGAGGVTPSDSDAVETPYKQQRSHLSVYTDGLGRWFMLSQASGSGAADGLRLIRAGTDANAKRRHVLPLLTSTARNPRLDGRTPYVRVK